MLLQFTFENFKSFKEQTVLSLEASADKELPQNHATIIDENILKTAAIFGANASGKSTVFSALTAAILTIRTSNARQVNDPIPFIIPFRFDETSADKPTRFEFVFFAEGKKYVYGFSATRAEVISEHLYVYNTRKASTVFTRMGDDYTYTSPAMRKELKPIEERNASNKLFLATATAWNCKATKEAYLWFAERINTFSANYDQLINQLAPMFENDSDNTLKRFTTNLLRQADLNIEEFDFQSKDISTEQILQAIPQPIRELVSTIPVQMNKKIQIDIFHAIQDGERSKQFALPFAEESQGTKNLFLLAPLLKTVFDTGETLCIDEFDSNLHPALALFLIDLFHNPEVNKTNAQLIVSSHTMDLLSLSHLRRDQIYFTDKDRDTAVSELYSLDEFSPRMQEDVRKAYLVGRYGSIPLISEETTL